MQLSSLDWIIIGTFFLITLLIGLWSSRKAGKNVKQFFLSGNDMPWWLLGISMVATTFSADTPNLVTDIVRNDGVAGNWAWWAFLLTGMLTVFVYAKLWRRAGIVTDLEFYEMRYSGKPATYLRMFRAIYLGVVFNSLIMGTVLLAGIKISSIMLGLSAFHTVAIISIITVIYSSMGGLRGVIFTDFFQFALSMIGLVIATVYIIQLPEVGGLSNLISHENVVEKINFFPDFSNKEMVITLLVIPLAVQWWSVWYPGAEPGGGGYVAQRMLAAKDENEAVFSTLFFNIAHYALRPWPWILIALASLIIFPDLQSIGDSFNITDKRILKDDLAFPAMLTLLPKGLIGLLVASLLAALMSTLSTHLNWGSSYIVNDIYSRHVDPKASDKTLVMVGRLSTVVLMVLASLIALYVLSQAKEAFDVILQIGAGTGLIFILRWFWWRVNAYAEITAMVVSFVLAIYFKTSYEGSLVNYEIMILSILITTLAWVIMCFIGQQTDEDTLVSFFRTIRPHSKGWHGGIPESVITEVDAMDIGKKSLATEILMMAVGCLMVYTALFGVGYLLYGEMMWGMILLIITVLSAISIKRMW